MKKAKIILSIVALFAVIGGAFAFKASKFGFGPRAYTTTSITTITVGTNLYTTTGTFCTLTTPIRYIVTLGDVGDVTTTYYTSLASFSTTLVSGPSTIVRSFPVCATLPNTLVTAAQ